MASIDTKMSVTGLSQYKNAMNQAAQSVKTLDAQLKQNEAQYKASGDREKYMSQQAKLLEDKLKAQKAAAKSAQDALKQMKAQGVDPMNQSYQKFAQQLAQAETSVLETSAAINSLGKSEEEAAKGADQLTASVQGISKKISLDQVINGVNRITNGLETAAKKALELGKAITDAIMESAERGDNIATMASILGMDVESYQAYQKVFDTYADITVRDWRMAQNKIRSAMTSPSSDQLSVFQFLGISTSRLEDTGGGILEPVTKDVEEVFWDVGERIRQKIASGEITMLQANDLASAIFGNKYENLNPIFDKFTRETFKAAVDKQTVNDAESIEKLAALNDELIKLQGDFKTLQDQILAGMAPALEGAAKALDSMLTSLMDYLKTPDGQAMLERLGEAVSGIFEDLSNIDPDTVVENFVTVFQNLVSSFEWVKNNWGDVKAGLEGIVGVWAVGKVTSGALTIIQMINGLKGLTGGGGAAGTGGGLLSGAGATTLTGILTTALKASLPVLGTITVATLAIAAGTVLLGGSLNSSQTLKEAAERGKKDNEELNEFNATVASKSTNEQLKEAHTMLANWMVPQYGTTAIGELPDMQEFARRYVAFIRDFADDETMDAVSDIVYEKGADFAEDFLSSMEAVLLNENDYTGASQQRIVDMVDEIMHAVRERMAQEVVFIKVQPILAAGSSMSTLATSGVAGMLRGVVGNANGLPFVPFDGYVTALHRGERVLTAQQNRQYTFNNNTYFSGVNLHNGLEVDALTNSIADRQARQAAAYGAN